MIGESGRHVLAPFSKRERFFLRFKEKGGKEKELPVHHRRAFFGGL
jgi:hypothetical protein